MLMLIMHYGYMLGHYQYFNTSHVNVNLAVAVVTPILPCNFNTSHVNVNLYGILWYKEISLISIHLMLMLIMVNHTHKGE